MHGFVYRDIWRTEKARGLSRYRTYFPVGYLDFAPYFFSGKIGHHRMSKTVIVQFTSCFMCFFGNFGAFVGNIVPHKKKRCRDAVFFQLFQHLRGGDGVRSVVKCQGNRLFHIYLQKNCITRNKLLLHSQDKSLLCAFKDLAVSQELVCCS